MKGNENSMASDRVDSVARRLCLAYFTSAGGVSLSVPGRALSPWEEMPDDVRYVWRGVARTAIKIGEEGSISIPYAGREFQSSSR